MTPNATVAPFTAARRGTRTHGPATGPLAAAWHYCDLNDCAAMFSRDQCAACQGLTKCAACWGSHGCDKTAGHPGKHHCAGCGDMTITPGQPLTAEENQTAPGATGVQASTPANPPAPA